MRKERLEKLLSREFLIPFLVCVIFVIAFFVKDDVTFNDFAFWVTVTAGIPAGALTVQKLGNTLRRG